MSNNSSSKTLPRKLNGGHDYCFEELDPKQTFRMVPVRSETVKRNGNAINRNVNSNKKKSVTIGGTFTAQEDPEEDEADFSSAV